jgi:hypothetical protein
VVFCCVLGCLAALGCSNLHHASSSQHGHISRHRHRLKPEARRESAQHQCDIKSAHPCVLCFEHGGRARGVRDWERVTRESQEHCCASSDRSHRSLACRTSQQRHQHTIVIDIIAHHRHRLRHQPTPGPAESSDRTTPRRLADTSCLAPQRGVVWVHRVRASHAREALGHTPVQSPLVRYCCSSPHTHSARASLHLCARNVVNFKLQLGQRRLHAVSVSRSQRHGR